MKILVIDNYDSFVYNIIHYLKDLGVYDIDIVKNDKVKLDELSNYDNIIISPGPGVPREAGKIMEVLHHTYQSHSILGICLGHQAIGEYFGLPLKQLSMPLHGVTGKLKIIKENAIFDQLEENNSIGHYHSWVLEEKNNNHEEIEILAMDENNNIMAIKHKAFPVYGLQFHPESLLTENGKIILSNWLNQK